MRIDCPAGVAGAIRFTRNATRLWLGHRRRSGNRQCARWGQIDESDDYPVCVNNRYVMAPSPIPKFNNPKMHQMPALQLFGAGRENRIYAIPPCTDVRSPSFADHPFEAGPNEHACELCGATETCLDEIVLEGSGRL